MTEIYSKNLLKGKTAFVAGGSSGINLGIAEQYAELGANLVILSRSQDKIDVAVKGLKKKGAKALGIATDVRDYDGVLEAFKKTHNEFGDIHCVISGAAGNFSHPLLDCPLKAFKPSLILISSGLLTSFAQVGIT